MKYLNHIACIICHRVFRNVVVLVSHQELHHECDLCYAADDYEWSDHTGIEAVWVTTMLSYDDGSRAPFTDMMRLCECCRRTLPDDGETIITPVIAA